MQVQKQKPHLGDHGRSNRSLFRRTIFLMVTLGVVLFIPLIAQLYKLQITEHSYWDERAANQQRNDVAVSASRGTIYDREGRAMAPDPPGPEVRHGLSMVLLWHTGIRAGESIWTRQKGRPTIL